RAVGGQAGARGAGTRSPGAVGGRRKSRACYDYGPDPYAPGARGPRRGCRSCDRRFSRRRALVIYLDSAAVAKLVRTEPSTEALVGWLNVRTDVPLVSSVLVEVEVPRALRRSDPTALPAVPATLARITRLEVDVTVRAVAASFLDPRL